MYRKGISALIKNNKEEFLLVNLHSFEEKYFAIPGGGLDEGETLEDAVYREIKEELGIDKDKLKYIGESDEPLRFDFKVIKLSRDGKEYKGSEKYVFGFEFLGNEIIIPDNEVRAYKWVSLEDLDKYLLFDGQLDETVDKINEIFKKK